MARGIWKNGLVKIFLTRSCLGFIFRPLLYSREEAIHFEFLCPFIALTKKIVRIPQHRERSLLYYWMIEIPQTMFEELFLSDEQSQRVCSMLDYADNGAVADSAYLTQGYVWDCLERLLKADSCFCHKFGMEATELQKLMYSILGRKHPSADYQQWFSHMPDNASDLTSSPIQQIYLERMVSNLTGGTTSGNSRRAINKLLQEGRAFCLWKMINAKYTTITMLEELGNGSETLPRLL
jgi:hypothetical protein